MSDKDQVVQIKKRIAYLRDILDIEAAHIAKELNISYDEYVSYESGDKDIPISILYGIAKALGVDATELLTGEAPRMQGYTVTRSGQGIDIERFEGYSFESLAYNFIGKNKEPMLVTIEPSEQKPELVTHMGQEFNYVLEGKVAVIISDKTINLQPGDSIYFNPLIPHGQYAPETKAKFLTIIDK